MNNEINDALYEQMEKILKSPYVDLHVIYEPDGCGYFGDCYCAAADLLVWGLTFRVYFKINEKNEIEIKHAERWHFG